MEKNIPKPKARFTKLKLLFCILAVCGMPHAHAQTDYHLLQDIYVGRPAGFKDPAAVIVGSAYPISLAMPVCVFLYGAGKHDKKTMVQGLQLAGSLTVAVVGTYAFKYAVNRNRPYIDHPEIIPDIYENSSSFPSGHTSLAFSTATSLSLQYRKWYVVVPSYLWAGAVAYSRTYQGVHYPSDVLAGAVIGAGSAYITYQGQRWIEKHWLKKWVEYKP